MRRSGRRLPTVLWRAVRPLRAVSALGWAVLGLGALLTATGWRLGWVEIATAGVALLAAVAAAVLLTLGRSTYAVELDLADRRVTVGQRAVGRILVRNTSRRRLLPAGIELPVGRRSADFPLPSLGPGATHEDLFAIPTSRRGVVVVGPVRSVRGDPLGLVRRRVLWTDPVELFVHPEVVALTGAAAGVRRDLEGQATRVLSDSDMSFHALRDYEPGDDKRHIHWKTTARIGTLMVRQFQDTRRTHTAVALATQPRDFLTEDEFELAVAAAASIVVQALRDERDVTFLAGEGPLRVDSPARLLDDVAALTLGTGRATRDLAPWVTRLAADASVAVLVTGSQTPRAELRRRADQLPVGVRTLVLTCRVGSGVDVVTHGSLSVAQVGALADLPRVLRRVVGT